MVDVDQAAAAEDPDGADLKILSQEQERRLLACRSAREILSPRGFTSSSGSREVIRLACYIETGKNSDD